MTKQKTAEIQDARTQDPVTGAPAPDDALFLDPAALTPEQTALMVDALSSLTELDADTIRACRYSNSELAEIFNRAGTYHNAYISNREKILASKESETVYTSGEYRRSATLHDFGVIALKRKIDADHYEQSLTRLTQAITTRAILKTLEAK